LKSGQITIYEPGLDEIFLRNQKEGRLKFTTSLSEGIKGANIIFLALPTPPDENGSADLKYVLQVADELGKILEEYAVIVDKSTVPVGTADKVRNAVEKNATVQFDIVSNPEFLREGVAVEDFMKPDRVIIGVENERAKNIMTELYAPFVRSGNPLIYMDLRSAELTKYAANSFLAMKISFMNEVAQLCERLDADVDMVRLGIGSDSRIGKKFLYPGIGVGGSCFPKDIQALVKSASEVDYDFEILNSVIKVNQIQRVHLVSKINRYYAGALSGKHFAVWGLSFKPNTDDIREASSLYMIDALLKMGATLCAFDPEAIENAKKYYGAKINFAENQYDALNNADALIIATEWNEFRSPDFNKIAGRMKDKVIFDGRNLYANSKMQELGYHYESIGRSAVQKLK
ncbi:MAG: UDP-glucose dehydrogenase family protein, partial [Bacteroidota bacterium]